MVNHKIPLLLFLPIAAFIACAAGGKALAFHDGSVAACEGCHTMHNSSGGVSMNVNPLAPWTANAYLLQGGDPSSTCLRCHQSSGDIGPTSFHVSTPESEMPAGVPPKQLSPGGDFGWLKKSYSWFPALGQAVAYSYGERHGHNIRSSEFGYAQDATKASAPGGAYPSASLSCISCHDPHGKYRRNQDGSITTSGTTVKSSGSLDTSPDPDGSASVGAYRLLGGAGYLPKSIGGGLAFINSVPAAVAPEQYNRVENVSVTRVAYGAGMSDWCRNCHSNIHDTVYPGLLTHPAGVPLGTTLMDNYNKYVKTGTVLLSPGEGEATSYLSLAPFEIGTNNYAVLKGIVTNTPGKGPNVFDGTPGISCLTCHRAHASGWDSATRWNAKPEFIVYNGNYSQMGEIYQPYGQGRTEMEALRAYYETPAAKFATMQKSLCNKCHINDGG